MTARQAAARRDMALVTRMVAGAPGDRGPEFWVAVARNVCAAHGCRTLAGPDDGPDDPGLAVSDRQADVLRLLAEGRTRDQVARDLRIAPDTVRSHLFHAYRRLGATSAAHAVALCIRAGLI